ncbi:MAG: hypothetical protein AB8B51_01080 [Sedimentitalea sp.]
MARERDVLAQISGAGGLLPRVFFCDQQRKENISLAVNLMAEPDPALAGAKATMSDALELNALSVIGVIDGHNGTAALLRSARGQIARVSTGETIFGITVNGIGEDRIVMTDRWGRTQSLALPRG